MISIRKSADELERLAELYHAAMQCYKLALRSVSQYALDLDSDEAALFRRHLQVIEEQWSAASGPDGMEAAQASLRGELREYRDQLNRRLGYLRQQVDAGAQAMATFAAGVAANDADHEHNLKNHLDHLGEASQGADLGQMRHAIQKAVSEIHASMDQIRRRNSLVIANLQDEIRMLHQEFQSERRVLFTDPGSGAWTRQKIEGRVEELFRQEGPFCVLLIAVHNLKRLEQRHSQAVVDGALKAMIKRLHGLLGSETLVGRWDKQEFAAILADQAPGAISLSREATRKLSGTYSIQENGIAQEVTIQVATGVIDRGAAIDPGMFRKKLGQLASALSHA